MNRRDVVRIGMFGLLFGGSLKTVTASISNRRQAAKLPCDGLDWMSNTVDFIKSPFRGRIILVDDKCCEHLGPKIACKEFPSNIEVKFTSEEYQFTDDINLKRFYIVDKHANVIISKEVNESYKACTKVTLTSILHLPTVPFAPCVCEPQQPVGLTPTPLEE